MKSKENRFKFFNVFTIIFIIGTFAHSKEFVFSAKGLHRFYQNQDPKFDRAGLESWIRLEQKWNFADSGNLVIQGYGYVGDRRALLYSAFDGVLPSNTYSEIWPGDTYVQFTGQYGLIRAGYQTILWQEGLGLTYTNLINARDFRTSFFDANEYYHRSAPVLNWLFSRKKFSLQTVILPILQNDIGLPAGRLGLKEILPTTVQEVTLEKPKSNTSTKDWGLRGSWSGDGFDLALFFMELTDRNITYQIAPSSTAASLILTPEQTKSATAGLSTSIDLSGYLLRIEYVRWIKRKLNFYENSTLDTFTSGEDDIAFILDSPAGDRMSYSLQHSMSKLENIRVGSLRKQIESFSSLYLNFNLKKENSINARIVAFHHDQSYFWRLGYSWPINGSTEAELNIEGSTGKVGSLGKTQEDLRQIFLQISQAF